MSAPPANPEDGLQARTLDAWRRQPSLRIALGSFEDAPALVIAVSDRAMEGNAKSATEYFSGDRGDEAPTDPSVDKLRPGEISGLSEVFPLIKDPALPYQGRILLGRAPGNDICIPIPTVSRVQVSFRRHGESWRLKELGSTNGTFVNGRKLRNQQTLALANEDFLAFGPHVYARFYTHEGFLELISETLDGRL